MKIPSLAGILLFAFIPRIAAAEWFANVEAGLFHDDNLANAELARDIFGDTSVGAAAAAGQAFQLTDSETLILQGRLRKENFNRFHELDYQSTGASLALRRKWGLGPYAPWARLAASTERLDYRDDLRSGWLHGIGISAGKRVAEQWELGAELLFERRRADNSTPWSPTIAGDVFDQSSRTLAFDLRYARNDSLQFSLGCGLRRGDIASTTQDRLRKAFAVSKAIAEDEALGEDAYAYKLNATTGRLQAGMLVTFGPQLTLSLEYQRFVTHAEGDNRYAKSLSSATLAYGF